MKRIVVSTKHGLNYHEVDYADGNNVLTRMNNGEEFIGIQESRGTYYIYKKEDVVKIRIVEVEQ